MTLAEMLPGLLPGLLSGGSVGGLLTFLVARRKIEVGREGSLVGPLNSRISHLERQVAELTHQLANAVTEADSLLLAVKYAPPERVKDIVKEIERKRSEALQRRRERESYAAEPLAA